MSLQSAGISLIRSIILVSLMAIAGQAGAQQGRATSITGDFVNMKFVDFAKEVRSQIDYKIYFDPVALDSTYVTLHVRNERIDSVLSRVLSQTDFHFVIDAQKNIFITRQMEVVLPPPGFFNGTSGPVTQQKVNLDYLEEERKENTRLRAENKQYDIGKKTSVIGTGNATISGYVRTASSGEPIVGSSVYVENPMIGVSTDQFGYFTLTMPKGKHELHVKSIGMKSTTRRITLYSDGKLTVELQEDVTTLKEVVVESERGRNVSSVQMGLDRLDMKAMKKIPVAFGEVDIFKVVLTLPGVQTVGEGTSGLNVRGGATDQNLILFDDAIIYNPTHLFGFFSAFNSDIIKNVELYKSAIPAGYGGRLSSVLDVNSREGNKKKFSGAGGIGPVTGRIVLEGPLVKDKGSFLVAGRSSYSNWLLRKVPVDVLKNSKAAFYDLNVNLDYELNSKNSIYVRSYFSRDKFTLNNDTTYQYDNKAISLKWKHNFNDKLYGVAAGGYSGYDYQISSAKNQVDAFNMLYKIGQTNLKLDFSWFPRTKHTINFGGQAIRYSLSPGSYLKNSDRSEVVETVLPPEQGIESAVYAGDQVEISSKLSLYAGLRYSFFNYLGPRKVFVYQPGETRDENNVIDSINYTSGKPIVSYHGPEYRVSVKFSVADNASLKFSYNRTRQYIQMLSNTAAISPTDIWKLSDTFIRPQIGDQFSLGFYRNFRIHSSAIEASVETYYKTMKNSLDYKGGARLLMNSAVERDLITAQGKAYGLELLLKKMNGKINGWVSYTYSRSLLRTVSEFEGEAVNGGKYYPSNYDKPHAFNFIGNYKISHRYSTSLNVTYSTGRPVTLPVAVYYVDDAYRVLYQDRNGYRVPDYFRMDFSVNIEGNHRIKKLAHGSWTLGIYNLTGRRNAYSAFFQTQNGMVKGYKLSVFGSPIPTITYNFKF